MAEDRPAAGSPVSASYWIINRDTASHSSEWFWVERVVLEIPATVVHTVVVEPLQPHPVFVDACRLGPLQASGRLSSDSQSIQVTLFGSVELEFRDLDGQWHRRRHPFVLRHDVPGRDLPPTAGVRVAPAGRVVSGQLVKSGRRPAYRARLELLMLVHLTEAVLRQGLPGDGSPSPILLPVQRLPRSDEVDQETHPLDESTFSPAGTRKVALHGIVELESGFRLAELESRVERESLLVRVLAEHPDGSRHAEEFAVRLPLAGGEPGSQRPRLARENLEPHPHLPGQYQHAVELVMDQQETQNTPPPSEVDPFGAGETPGPGKNGESLAPAREEAVVLSGAGNGLERQEARVMAGNGGGRRPRPVLVWKIPGKASP